MGFISHVPSRSLQLPSDRDVLGQTVRVEKSYVDESPLFESDDDAGQSKQFPDDLVIALDNPDDG